MLHMPDDAQGPSLKQIEFNTISSSFGGLAVRVARLHKELATFPNVEQSAAYPPHAIFGSVASSHIRSQGTPTIEAVSTLASGLAAAHSAYGKSKSNPALPLCIVILVQDGERNLFDQMALTEHLKSSRPDVPTFRLPVSKILVSTSILPAAENPARPLVYTSPANPNLRFEVSTVYFRALYAPTEYDTPTSWAARHHLERSVAIKCPSVLLHLAGSKKVQQVLADKSSTHLERLITDRDNKKRQLDILRESFAPQYSMSDGPDSEGVQIALDPVRAKKHVLKPQREGGGNNIYRDDIPKFLKSIPEKDYKQYILMELIQPPTKARNIALRSDGQVIAGDVISELGIFGTCLWENTPGSKDIRILDNKEGGYLLRTKARDSDEGGVAAGFSSLDSVILYDDGQTMNLGEHAA